CFHVTPDPTGAARSWAPIRALCRDLLGLRGKLTLDLLEAALRKVGLETNNLAGTAELFGVAGDFSGLEHAARRRECLASALQIVRTAAAQAPALVVFEDVDRYDAPSAEIVNRLLEDPGTGPLFVLATRARG